MYQLLMCCCPLSIHSLCFFFSPVTFKCFSLPDFVLKLQRAGGRGVRIGCYMLASTLLGKTVSGRHREGNIKMNIKKDVKLSTGLNRFRTWFSLTFFEQDDEHSGPIQAGNFLIIWISPFQ